MKRLILIRHAKAEPAEKANTRDVDRALSPRGQRDAQRMGQWLGGIIPSVDRVIASPARRTRETAEELMRFWQPVPPAIEYVDRLYLPSLDEVWAVIWSFEPVWETVALIGHNPSISELRDALTGTAHAPMPTCAIAVLRCQASSWAHVLPQRCSIEHYRTPAES